MQASSSAFQWQNATQDQVQHAGNAFSAFLRGQKTQLQSLLAATQRQPVHVTIGNEAADADSIVSSMVYAFMKQQHDANALYVPVLPIPRAEFVLRCDVNALFQHLHLDTEAVLFADEFPWSHAYFNSTNRLRMTLLDHNALITKRMQGLNDVLIVEILDHHMDLGHHQDANVREIAFQDNQALVGSCCTLVAEKLTADTMDPAMHSLLSTMLLAVISLDTINFNPEAKKVTPRDIAAAAALEAVAFASKQALYEWLHAEKFNPTHWDKFSIPNCLQCDYKEFTLPTGSIKYGVSAILIDLVQFQQKAASVHALEAALQAYCDENALAFLVVMSMVMKKDGVPQRQMLFYEATQAYSIPLIQCLEKQQVLQLEPMDLHSASIRAFHQKNTAASRKQVVPMIQDAFRVHRL